MDADAAASTVGQAPIRTTTAPTRSPVPDACGCEGPIALLREQSAIYDGRTAAEAERLRGSLLVDLGRSGLPAAALPFVIEDLATGLNSFAVAAAARALRASPTVPDGVVEVLLDAVERVRGADDIVSFEGAAQGEKTSSALSELFRTLAWTGAGAAAGLAALEQLLGQDPPVIPHEAKAELARAIEVIRAARPQASCCSARAKTVTFDRAGGADLAAVEVQDQDGAVQTLGRLATGHPTVLAFFYTRCENPEKCSLTISKLAALRRRLDADRRGTRINVFAISYDPAYDLPERLESYGAARGFAFDDRSKLLRTTGDVRVVRELLDLAVGYGPATVNQHSVELVVLDIACRSETLLRGARWSAEDVLVALGGRDPVGDKGVQPSR